MPPVLRIVSLWKCYVVGVRRCSARAWVLRGLSLTVQKGERVAIVGAPGSGKTTLVQCIRGLRVPTAGEIEVSGALEIIDHPAVATSALPERTPRPPDLPTSLIVARHPDALPAPVDRLYLLRDGRLHATTYQPARRVAEAGAPLR
jgi:hypothetical protein